MRKLTISLLIAAIALMGILPISAQDTATPTDAPTDEAAEVATEEVTEEAMEEATEEATVDETTDETTDEATEEDGSIVVNELGLTLPEEWGAIIDSEGYVLVADFNVDVVLDEAAAAGEDPVIPENPLVMRLIMAGIPASEEPQTVIDLVKQFTGVPEDGPAVEEVEVDGITFGRINASDTESGVYILGRYLADDLFLLASLVGPIDVVEAKYETALDVYLNAEPALQPMIPEEAELAALYSEIPQSTTEEGYPVLGDPEAEAKVTEIGSFACSACKVFHDQVYPELLDRIIAGEVVLTYVPIASTGSYPNGVYAAEVALCAGQQGQFWPVFDALYAAQAHGGTAFIPSRVEQAVDVLGLDKDAFDTCIAEGQMSEVVETAEQFALGVPGYTGTPALIVNDELLEGFAPVILNAAIDEALGIAPAEEATEEVTEEASDETAAEATEEVSEEATVEATEESTDD
ncbi:thioredoxin domain-containing protein [Phototrophicus methaneseepsis]|uniref:Thioredoxin domain-containing protein n=1 Tax=Phototrophicus methaneseepsis TaxID=2710758 RepID=A0A7S8E831_9CHLR|nr:thioredoxin domain-containing protein [Phototrophicus methaneseepsis]QPC82084.1 thioredoxin domain-containing protein [Phototrophicus methaneseepsis]